MKMTMLPTLLLFVATSALAATAPNLTGQWTVHNSIVGNESDMECKFIQNETKLTGTCKGTEKDVQITGSIDGNKVTWKFDSEFNGSPLTLTYTGVIDATGKIAGNVDVEPFAVTGEFTATPSKAVAKE
jgi:cytoskeletal protein CcmA (bactofilin family)